MSYRRQGDFMLIYNLYLNNKLYLSTSDKSQVLKLCKIMEFGITVTKRAS